MIKTIHILISLMAVGSMAIAGNVTIPNTFSANTSAVASEVNANFSAVKMAVDGNVVDIATNKTDIAMNEANITSNASNITLIESTKIDSVSAANSAGLTATRTGNDISLELSEGFVSISPYNFISGDIATCYGNRPLLGDPQYHFSKDSPSVLHVCWAFAPITLPNAAKMGSFRCKLYKNDGETDKGPLKVSLRYSGTTIASVELAADFNNDSWQTKSDLISDTYQSVDNEGGTYDLLFIAPFISGTVDGEKDRVGECTIEYFYN